jgi:hypothetical protein
MIKYILHPGYVFSKNDGDRHYVGWQRLAELYGVGLHECLIYSEYGQRTTGMTHLFPDRSGEYRNPT